MIKTIPQGHLEYVLAADEAQIIHIEIKPEFRRQGYGEKLLMEWLEEIKNYNYVILEVRVSNTAAINLYKKLGFTELNRRKLYYNNPPEDAIVMKLGLNQ